MEFGGSLHWAQQPVTGPNWGLRASGPQGLDPYLFFSFTGPYQVNTFYILTACLFKIIIL
jgi:hypothetical protein